MYFPIFKKRKINQKLIPIVTNEKREVGNEERDQKLELSEWYLFTVFTWELYTYFI